MYSLCVRNTTVNMNQIDLRYQKNSKSITNLPNQDGLREQRELEKKNSRATDYGYINSKRQNHWRNERRMKITTTTKKYRP